VAYTEKITWQGRSLTLAREQPPTKVADARGDGVRLEALDVTDAAVRPSNQDAAEGTPLPVFQAPGVRVDVSKRYRAPMGFWHRNMEHDELIFCHKGGMIWETELGTVTLRAGQMLLIPQGVAHRAVPPEGGGENILIELKIAPTAKKVFP
jgi:quercetin dioxygenase-like cupin family protein